MHEHEDLSPDLQCPLPKLSVAAFACNLSTVGVKRTRVADLAPGSVTDTVFKETR